MAVVASMGDIYFLIFFYQSFLLYLFGILLPVLQQVSLSFAFIFFVLFVCLFFVSSCVVHVRIMMFFTWKIY